MSKNLPTTLNQLISYTESKKEQFPNLANDVRFMQIVNNLNKMKSAPELVQNCNIDVKISNPNYYLDQINEIIKNTK